MVTFLNGGFWAYPARKHRLFDILDTKECFLDNSELLKSTKKEYFSKGVFHGFWPRNGHLSQWWFFGKSSQETSFLIF